MIQSTSTTQTSRVAIVHYWLLSMRGGEKVIESLCRLFPEADIFTLVADPGQLSPTINNHRIETSFLQRLGGKKHYQRMLPLMPFALESFDLRAYDLVISSEAGPAKGIITRPDSLHVCYCHSPMRYIWDLYPEYRAQQGAVGRAALSLFAPLLRQWDVTTAARVDMFVANSNFVRQRIKKYYRREADVIHPPVNVEQFSLSEAEGDYYLCAGQITPYKRIDIAVKACSRMSKPLTVIGGGITSELRAEAGPTIRFIDRATDSEFAKVYANCRALIYPGMEDFGIVPLEAAACGKPVLAYGKGGALETVINGVTGLHFQTQSVDALCETIDAFERRSDKFDKFIMRAHAQKFSRSRFEASFLDYVLEACKSMGLQTPVHRRSYGESE